MPNIVGKIPDFTKDDGSGGQEEVKEAKVSLPEGGKDILEKETETPSELPTEEKPAEGVDEPQGDGTGELEKQVQGLQREKQELLKHIVELRGQRREIKQEEFKKVDEKIDELIDVHPDDAKLIEKVLRSKGYVTKDEAQKMFYEAVKQEELNKFLDKYPEYKPENDSNDLNWQSLQTELKDFGMPSDPHRIGHVLEKAHRLAAKFSGDRSAEVKKRIETASVGGGGTQRSSSSSSLTPEQRRVYEDGGWSQEEIKQIEKRLT
jgi:hypothetical protein